MSAPYRTFRGIYRYVLAGAIGLAFVAVLLVVFEQVRDVPCGDLFETDTEECIGVVKSKDILDPILHSVVDKIFAENGQVRSSPPQRYVKVVLLTPLSVAKGKSSATSLDQVRYSLEGALTGLHRANSSNMFGAPAAMKIELILVNYGSRQVHSDALVDAILAESEQAHPVVAVVGLGSSFASTELTAKAFAERNMPIVTAVATANSLTAERFPTLHSVSPSNEDYALALRKLLDDHLKPSLKLESGIIVADSNADPYVSTLKESYNKNLAPYIKVEDPLPFVGSTVDTLAAPDVFAPVVTNLCTAVAYTNISPPVQIVFYAGRVVDFEAFARALETRTCKLTPLVVLVGATGFHMADKYANVLESGNVTVMYVTTTDADAWKKNGDHVPAGFMTFREEFAKLGFSDESLADGYAIMYHEATVTAAQAVRLAAQGPPIPAPADVNVQFGNITHAFSIRGASGTLVFGRSDGRAKGKLVVYRQIGINPTYALPTLAPYVTQ